MSPAQKPQKKSTKPRRTVVRVRERSVRDHWASLLSEQSFTYGMLSLVLFVLAVGSVAAWTREQPSVAIGRIVDKNRVVRVEFSTTNEEATADLRDAARQRTPRVFSANAAGIDELINSIEFLPQTLAGAETIDQVAPEIREQFGLTAETAAAVRALEGEALDSFRASAARLRDGLLSRPLLDRDAYQRATQQNLLSRSVELRYGDEVKGQLAPRDRLVDIGNTDTLRRVVSDLAAQAGFSPEVRSVVVSRLLSQPRPTFAFDPAATQAEEDSAAVAIDPETQRFSPGEPIWVRGDRVTPQQLERDRAERAYFSENAGMAAVWGPRLGVIAGVAAVGAIGAAYIAGFCPRIRKSPSRIGWIAGLSAGAAVAAMFATIAEPKFVGLTAVAPPVLVSVLLVIAYDQRIAGFMGGLTAVAVMLGLNAPVSMLLIVLVGIGVAVWRLPDIRDRRSVISMSGALAAALVIASVAVSLVDRPLFGPSLAASLQQALTDAAFSGVAGLLVGATVLFALPSLERVFDITTGMTLIELRDPKNPLLREMQQRAPGTYNHSLNVASIAETAATAINADSLLTYVGGLYHDIGKINKPEYFVENQSGGPNKHDKLSPAMSLLVIVGHVKDGLEMAREHALPRELWHFIEAHHGTTLVEFFYHRARQQAKDAAGNEDEEDRLPDEVDYRYPGPRPRTKEVAILMLADAVESATRTLAEPTPSRIDTLVREMANRRLMDGQFDECDLTLKELQTISESISKTVASIYHGRIKYPSSQKRSESRSAEPKAGDPPAEPRTA